MKEYSKISHDDLFSVFMLNELRNLANNYVLRFCNGLKPILLRLGLWDDEHIKKYLRCDSLEEVYKDAKKADPQRIKMIREFAESFGETDFWEPLRSPYCDSPKNPEEKGFVFGEVIFGIQPKEREKILKAIKVKGCCFSIDEDILREEAVIEPTQEQLELFNMVDSFCNLLRNKGVKRKTVHLLLRVGKDGYLEPCTDGIFFNTTSSLH